MLMIANLFASAQSGITWSTPMDIAASTFNNDYPCIALDGNGNPLVLWGNSNKAEFSRWNGSSFTTPVSLNPTSLPVYATSWTGPDIASKGDTVYVVYKKTPLDTLPIYIVRSFDGGITFSSPVQIAFIADSISWLPTITTDATGNPVVAFMKLNSSFMDSRWVVTKSTDFGNTFSTDVKASGYSSAGEVCDCCPGSIVSSSNKMAVLYRDNLSNIRDMWSGISMDGGNSFPSGINIDQNNWNINACPASGPDGVIVDDTLYSVFMSGASGKNLVYTNKNSLSNLTSSTGNLITGNFTGLTQQNFPRIANYNSAVAKVWKQVVSGGAQVSLYFTTNIHNGFSPAYDTVALSIANTITNADVAVGNGEVHVVWQDDGSGTVKYRKGFFSSSAGINSETDVNSISVYPNPSNGKFNLKISQFEDLKIESVEIYNVYGQKVDELMSGRVNELNPTQQFNNSITLDLSNQPSGVYFVKANQGSNFYFQKFVKQ